MDSVQLAGVALAALLSENFILVNCLGIGTRVEAFHSTTAARRTGLSLTLAMVVTVFFTWCADFLVLRHFGWVYPGGPDELRRPAGGDQPHQLPPALPRPGHRDGNCRPDGPGPGWLLRAAPVLIRKASKRPAPDI